MNDKCKLLECLSAAEFAAWEIRLFLDTHPDDKQALAAGNEYSGRADVLRREYEKRYGALTADLGGCEDNWTWISDPWPWDFVKGE